MDENKTIEFLVDLIRMVSNPEDSDGLNPFDPSTYETTSIDSSYNQQNFNSSNYSNQLAK